MFIRGHDRHFEIIGRKKYWFAFSGLLIVVAILAIATLGLNLGLEFKGGYQLRLSLDQPATVSEINDIVGTFPDFAAKSTVQTANDNKTVIIKLPTVASETALVTQLQSTIEAKYGFTQGAEQEQVGSEWGREVSKKAVISLAVFLGMDRLEHRCHIFHFGTWDIGEHIPVEMHRTTLPETVRIVF